MPRLPLRERVIDLEVPEHDVARGRALRKATPRSALAELSPARTAPPTYSSPETPTGCLSWFRCGTPGCWPIHSPSTAGRLP